MWRIFTRPGVPPFRPMDRVGLDVVLAYEEHQAAVRPGTPRDRASCCACTSTKVASASRAGAGSPTSRAEPPLAPRRRIAAALG
jgi:hypothetical protein